MAWSTVEIWTPKAEPRVPFHEVSFVMTDGVEIRRVPLGFNHLPDAGEIADAETALIAQLDAE